MKKGFVSVNKESLQRALYMLMVVNNLLNKQNESDYVLNLLSETLNYDGTECDGMCVMEDIKWALSDFDIEANDEQSYSHYIKYDIPDDFRTIDV